MSYYAIAIRYVTQPHLWFSTGLGQNFLRHYKWTFAKINLPPLDLFQPSIGVRPMPIERIQQSAMMPFALRPVTTLLYLKGAQHNNTLGLVVVSYLSVIVSHWGKVNIWGHMFAVKHECIIYFNLIIHIIVYFLFKQYFSCSTKEFFFLLH